MMTATTFAVTSGEVPYRRWTHLTDEQIKAWRISSLSQEGEEPGGNPSVQAILPGLKPEFSIWRLQDGNLIWLSKAENIPSLY